jgi:membrane-associated protease RseP (regulator of RpoE activity)
MAYTLGIILFAVGILFAVCLHEAGHMATAKVFGMKVTRYFVGFGPTLWSFRKGETEYGVKAIPLGGFVKIVGMTPQDDDVRPEDEPRAMWRFPVWKRTIVMAAGSLTHFALAVVTLWLMFVFIGIPDGSKVDQVPAKIASVSPCVSVKWQYDPATKGPKQCDPATDPKSPAAQAGLRPGDVITAINDQAVPNYGAMRAMLRNIANQDITITYRRGSETHTATAHVLAVERIKDSTDPAKTYAQITASDLERAGMLGVGMDIASQLPVHHAGPIEGLRLTFTQIGHMAQLTFESFKKIPEKIPNLVGAIAGHQRDPETPVSVVGASRIGGELFQLQDWLNMLSLFATLNLFFGIFNLLPLLPMDGGHIAIAWFERARSWVAARLGRPDPGRVDYYKLTPITLAVISIMGVFVLLTVTADIVNPITLSK